MFPTGNNVDQLSLFLEYTEAKNFPVEPRWHRCVQFSIRLANVHDDSVCTFKEANHRFWKDEIDWGFNSFIRLRDLSAPVDGDTRPLLEDDSFDLYVYIRSIKDECGTLWNNFSNWDSKEETGYVGLKNQGATCYMNSLLQSLYFTNYFRKAVFQIPTDNDQPSKSVSLALQRLFYHLQHSDRAIDTRELTKSFGWDTLDAFMQHDIQEFNRVLQDNLESKMKSTKAEGAIERLFVGKMKSYIKCVNVDYESSREETFYDIQLNVKGKANLHDSFKDYVSVEMMDGENKYQSEKYGLQDAKKGVIFTSFPPVLHLQLKRFEYDFNHDTMVKINDRHEYPLEIELTEFLESPPSEPQIYALHGVLVHSGDVHGGHYYAFIRPKSENKWFKFDDDHVIPVNQSEVMEKHYGENATDMSNTPAGTPPLHTRRFTLLKRFTNAYMLVYIRKSDIPEILSEVTTNDIPSHLAQSLRKEHELKEKAAKETAERHLYLRVHLLRHQDIAKYQGFDLGDDSEDCAVPDVKVKKDLLWGELCEEIARANGLEVRQIRLWSFCRRQNKTVRPDTVIPFEKHRNDTVESVYVHFSRLFSELLLYLEILPVIDNVVPMEIIHEDEAAIFIKYFDVESQTMEYLGNIVVKTGIRGNDLIPILRKLKQFPDDLNIRIYEEVKPAFISPLKLKATLADSEITSGDILCFQKEVAKNMDSKMITTVPGYYEFLQLQVQIEFRQKPKVFGTKGQDDTGNKFKLMLSKRTDYDGIIHKLADHLKADPEKIRLFANLSGSDLPRNPIHRVAGQTLHEIIQACYCTPSNFIFFFEVTEINVKELEALKSFSFIVFDEHLREVDQVQVLVNKSASYAEVAEAAKSANKKLGDLIFFEIRSGKTIKPILHTETIAAAEDNDVQIAACQRVHEAGVVAEPTATGKLVRVFHFGHDISRTHSIPFQLVIEKDSTVADLKTAIRSRLNIGNDKDMAKIRLAYITEPPRYLEDDSEQIYGFWKPTDFLGLQYAERSSVKQRAHQEKTIKIHN